MKVMTEEAIRADHETYIFQGVNPLKSKLDFPQYRVKMSHWCGEDRLKNLVSKKISAWKH